MRRLGQNFLIDKNIARKIVRVAEITCNDVVLEIGPGRGALTEGLLSRVKAVSAVEIDRRLCEFLREKFKDAKNFTLINKDFLRCDFSEFSLGASSDAPLKLKVIANIPYYITSPVISHLIENRSFLEEVYLTVQEEVAHRIVAAPGRKAYGAFSIYCQFYTEPKLLFKVPRTVFRPMPEVDSAFIRLRMRDAPPVVVKDEARFFKLVRAAFGKRRKMLGRALRDVPGISLGGVDEVLLRRRGETLSIAEFAALANIAL